VAIAASYVVAATLLGIPLVVGGEFLEIVEVARLNDIIGKGPGLVTPVVAFLAAQGRGPNATRAGLAVAGCGVFSIVATGLLVLLASRWLNRSWGHTRVERTTRPWRLAILFRSVDIPIENPFRRVQGNPVYTFERTTNRGRFLGLEKTLFLLVLGSSALGTLFLTVVATVRREIAFLDGCIVWIAIQSAGLGMVAPALLVNLFARERERRTLDSLRMTLLSPAQVFRGKARYGALLGRILVVAGLLPWAPLVLEAFLHPQEVELLVMGSLTLVESVFIGVCAGVAASMATRRLTGALTLGYGIVTMLFFGNFILARFLQAGNLGISRIPSPSHRYFWLNGFSPQLAFIECANYVTPTWLQDGQVIWMASIVLHMVAALCMVALGYSVFRRRYLSTD
jgi:hypothetical protein